MAKKDLNDALSDVFDTSNGSLISDLTKSSLTFPDRISSKSAAYWDANGVELASDEYEPIRNSIASALFNQIGEVLLQVQDFRNPLAFMKQGQMAMGSDVQEVATDIIKSQAYERGSKGKEPNQFEINDPRIFAAYHRINRNDQYPITISDIDLRQAFKAPKGLFNLIQEQIAQPYKSNVVDEFIYGKRLLAEFFNGKALRDTQKMSVGKITEDSTAEEIARWLIKVKNAISAMSFPNRDYTAIPIAAQSIPDELYLIVPYWVKNVYGVKNLSAAFNPEELNVKVQTVLVDNFGEGGEAIQGVIADKRTFQTRDIFSIGSTADNARGLYRNHFLTVRQLYLASPLKPVIYLTA